MKSDFKNVCLKLRAGDLVPVLVKRKPGDSKVLFCCNLNPHLWTIYMFAFRVKIASSATVVMFQVGAKEVSVEEVAKVRREFGNHDLFFRFGSFCSL